LGRRATFLPKGEIFFRMKTLNAFLLSAAVAGWLAWAQPSGRMGGNRVQHRINFLTTLLTLTSAQQQQATTIFTSAAANETTLRSNLKTAHDSLTTAIHNNDSAGLEQAATTIGNLTAQTTLAQAKADAAFYQILTPDQQTKLNQIESQGHVWHMGHGPGGFQGRSQ
jgi:Spy/CpxP family protein refolding chaperone